MITYKKYARATQLLLVCTISSLFQLRGDPQNFTGSLVGDITGYQKSTVVSFVGGVSAPSIATGVTAANAATNANTANTIVKRDQSGNFSAGKVTLNELDLFSTNTLVIAGNVAVQGNVALQSDKTMYVDHLLGASGSPLKTIAVTNMTLYGTYLSPSDMCLKTDITDLDNEQCLALVNQLVPHEFDYIPEVKKALGDDGNRHVGFIAQELAKVDPRFVSIAKGTQSIGSLKKEDLAFVKQELFIPLLVGALKAEDNNKASKADVAAMEARLEALEKLVASMGK